MNSYLELQVYFFYTMAKILIIITIIIIGRHCCLWCRITQQQLKPPPVAPTPQIRSLATLASAHADYMGEGNGDIRVVKNYFNVLSPPFFDVPLEQVKYFLVGPIIYIHPMQS